MFDHYVGQIISIWKRLPTLVVPIILIENTLSLPLTMEDGAVPGEIITDNFPLDRGKINAKEGGVRVPFIITGPTILPGQESHVMVNGLDFYPTILSWTGTKKPKDQNLDGADLSELLHTSKKSRSS